MQRLNRLQRGRAKSGLKKMSEILIYGFHPIQTVLDTQPERVLQLFIAAGSDQKRLEALLSKARAVGLSIQSAPRKTLDQWFNTDKHQGVGARLRPKPLLNEDHLSHLGPVAQGKQPLLLVLDGVQDPHNLGACLRTADAAGVDAVIIPKNQSATLSAVVHKVACGGAETVPLVQVSNLARCLIQLKKQGIWLAGASMAGAQSVYDLDCRSPLAFLLGAEGQGLRHLTQQHCDFLVHIPMMGAVQSLNVSVATGVCLYEALRQRRTTLL